MYLYEFFIYLENESELELDWKQAWAMAVGQRLQNPKNRLRVFSNFLAQSDETWRKVTKILYQARYTYIASDWRFLLSKNETVGATRQIF